MEPHPQDGQKTLAKAHRQATATHLKKGAHRLQKGILRFVNHNGRIVSGVALGAGVLLGIERWVRRPHASVRLPPRFDMPLRRRGSNASTVVIMGAVALIGAG